MKVVLSIFLCFLSSSVYSCFPVDSVIELTGDVVVNEEKLEEKNVRYKALSLDKEVCFSPDGIFSNKEHKLSNLQLVIPQNLKVEVNAKYKMIGAAFHWHTGHHYTKVLFMVESVVKLP